MLLGRGDKHDLPVAQSPQFFQACCVSSTLECGIVHHSKLDSRCPLWAALYPESGRTDRGPAKSALCHFCWLPRTNTAHDGTEVGSGGLIQYAAPFPMIGPLHTLWRRSGMRKQVRASSSSFDP